jgi:hypothetical protein
MKTGEHEKAPAILMFVIKAGFVFFVGVVLLSVFSDYREIEYAKRTRSAGTCLLDLRQIEAASYEFAVDKNLKVGKKINFPNDLLPYFKDGKVPICPSGGIYSIKKIGDVPTCSIGTNAIPAHALPLLQSAQNLSQQGVINIR